MRVPVNHTPVTDPASRVALCLLEVGYPDVVVVNEGDGLAIHGPVPPPPNWAGICSAFEKACRLVYDKPDVVAHVTVHDAYGNPIQPVRMASGDWWQARS